MNRTLCQYAIVRFLPFIETGEFANVGIILFAEKSRYFEFKLQTARHGRITAFFDVLDPGIYKCAIKDANAELNRVKQLLHSLQATSTMARTLFEEVIRKREVMVQFSEPRTVLTSDTNRTLQALYEYYVERNFVSKDYQDALLNKGLRKLLRQENLVKAYPEDRVGNDEFHVTFPFVAREGDRVTAIIKPLHLGQEDPTRIRERGNQWQFRLNELALRHLLPKHVLFAVTGPHENDMRAMAFKAAQAMLVDAGAQVLPFAWEAEILEFARAQSTSSVASPKGPAASKSH